MSTPEDLDAFMLAMVAIYGTASDMMNQPEAAERLGRLINAFPNVEEALLKQMFECLSRIGLIKLDGDYVTVVHSDEALAFTIVKAEEYVAWREGEAAQTEGGE